MAIYHLHAKVFKRSEGNNAIASAAYRRAAKLFDEKEQKTWDYTNKPDVIHSELIVPENAPTWAKTLVELHEINSDQASEKLWNFVEATEKRKDAQLAREVRFALPIELNQEQNITLAREFIKDQFVLRGMMADWNIHWDAGNPHVHAMLSMRELTEDGFGLKVRGWNLKPLLTEWRERWAEYANFHLRLHQHDVKIDHRSYQEQGIELIPTIHQGKAVSDMDSRGITTEIMKEANSIRRENLALIAADPKILLKKLSSHSPTFTHEQIGQELGRYINDKGKFSIQEKGILSESILQDSDLLNISDEIDSILTIDAISKIINSIEQHDSVFKERDIAKAVEPYTNHPVAFAKALIQVKASSELIHLGVGDDGRDRFTTRSMFQLENEIQKSADIMRNRSHLKIANRQIDKILEAHQNKIGKRLTPEQMEAVKHILSSSAISCLVGRAGTGKSFSLGAAKVVWEKQGLRVQGIALSGIAADGLNKDARINSRTIESFRYALSQGQVLLDSHDVVVMDEAGMTDSVSMLAVLKAIQAARAKLVLVGDHAQLQPVGAGASFRALVERLGFKEIQTIYRQKEQWQCDATVAFSSGHIAEGLAAYEAKDCIHLEKTPDTAVSQLVHDWFAARALNQKLLSEYLVVAHRNEDVRLLNRLLREQRVARNEIAEGYTVNTHQGEIKIAKDDRILFLKNDRRLGVSNGRFATIKSVDFTESGKVLAFTVMLDGTDKEVRINPAQYADFAYGYAATVHKVQGMTVDHSFVYAGGSSWNRHLTYVALSRHRYTSHLYAEQETYQDFKTLQRHLGRFGIKDSLLDFPLAFAERRGIETERLLKLLPQHLAKRLATLKDKVATRVEEFFDPIGFAERRATQVQKQLEDEKIALRREDAKLVAAYVDVNQAVGMTWQALQTKLQALGLDKMSFEAQAFSIISGTKEYAALQHTLHEREAKAFQIVKDLSRYELAIDIHNLDVNKLKQQAEQYTCSQRVKQYLQERQRGAIIHRDRLAAEIMPAIKQHYSYLKSAGINGQEIKQCSIFHLRRQLFNTLTPEERVAFRTVERYQLLARQIGEQWSTPVNHAKEPIKRSQLNHLSKLSLGRDQLASQILKDRQYYDKALDFYQIGMAAPHFGEQPTEKHIHEAEVRWYKLQQQAARYNLQKRVETYHQALFVGNMPTRLRLANEIVQDAKAHHGFVISLGANTTEVWRAIRRDAKLYERHEYYNKLSVEDRYHFQVIESYVEAKQAHASAWREIFEGKKTANIDEKTLYARLSPYAMRYTQMRNELADKVVADAASYTSGLDYFKITAEELQPQAYTHQCRVNVDHYIHADNPLIRAQHALAIIADPKAHHGAVVEKGVQWRDIYKVSKIAERKILFANLSSDEKSLYRLADRYREANQKAGKIFSEFKKQSANQVLSGDKNNRIEVLFAKRDYLAWRLVNSAQAINPDFLTEFSTNNRLNVDKLLQQHAKQVERLTCIEYWESAYHHTIQTAQSIYPHLNASQEFISNGLQKTFSAIEHTLQLQKAYRLNQNAFNYALQIQGLSSEMLSQKIQGIVDLKGQLQSLVTLRNLDKNKLIEKPVTHINNSLPAINPDYKKIDINRLREDLNARAGEVTQHYLGQPKVRSGSAWRYGSHQGSLVVNISGQKQGLWRDFQTGIGGDMLSLIQQAMETSNFKAVLEEATRFVGGYSSYQQPLPSNPKTVVTRSVTLDDYTLQKVQKAQAIFQGSQPIAGTLAERYLREQRGISTELNDKTLRYHPHLKNWMTGDTYPALVIAARDEKEQICGIQAIFLDPKTARKAPIGHHTKLSRGLIGEGAVVHQGSSSGKIAFAEGIETALSVASAHPDWKVYTTFGVSNFDKVPLESKSPDVLLCADNDGLDSGTAKSVERAANILAHRGVNVWLAEPQKPDNQKKWDFNDALTKQGVSQVRNDLNNAKLYKKGIMQDSITEKLSSTLEILGEDVAHKIDVQQGIVPTTSIDNLTYETILAQYVEMEIQQTQMTHAMHAARLKNPKAGRELAAQALTHSNTIKAFAVKVAEHPEFKAEIEKFKKDIKPTNLAKLGGFTAIAERLKQGKITSEDIKVLTTQLRNKALEHTRSQVQDRDRGGRSK